MWWQKKAQRITPKDPSLASALSATPILDIGMTNTTPSAPSSTAQNQTVLGRSVVMRGELSGNEDLLIEGQFEGTISLQEHCLTVGTHGQVKAEIHARQVVIFGTVNGNISAREKVEIRKTGHAVGDLVAGSIAIEEGAYFKGSIDILREEAQEAPLVLPAPTVLKTSA